LAFSGKQPVDSILAPDKMIWWLVKQLDLDLLPDPTIDTDKVYSDKIALFVTTFVFNCLRVVHLGYATFF